MPVERVRGFIGYLYRHPFIRYLFVGGTTFMLDIVLLIVLHSIVKLSLPVATSISYWTSILYNFCLNRWWTFNAREKENLHQHAIAYGMLLGVNYLFTVLFVSQVSQHINYAIAKALAVMIQMSWTYLIYKKVIFIKRGRSGTSEDTTVTTSTA